MVVHDTERERERRERCVRRRLKALRRLLFRKNFKERERGERDVRMMFDDG
jgi:hypothetical protein